MASIKPYNLKSGELRYEVFISNGIDPGTKRQNKIHKKGFRSWDEANNYAKITEGEIAKGDYQKNDVKYMTIEQFLKIWITDYKMKVKEGTRIVHRENIRMYIKPYIGKFKLTKYSRADHQKLINKLFTLEGKGRSQKGLSYNTVQSVNATLSNAYRKAIQLGYVNENPTQFVEFPLKPKAPKVPPHYSADEVDQFYEAAKKEHEPFWYPFFLLIFDCGLRKAEVMALRWSDFDFTKSFVSVERERLYRAEAGANKDAIIIDETKTPSGERDLPITQRTKFALIEFYKYFYDKIGITPLQKNNSDYIFIYTTSSSKGKIVRNRSVNGASVRIAKRAKLPPIKVHDGRHTFAIRMRQAGVDLDDIKDLLGHKDISTTQIYASVTPEVKERSMKKFEEYLEEQKKKHS
ncbi:tyrosine-type recombinase/integrase [Enterococcus dongliensis]|uniref:tyrosine-type recombinase/integrase n=1 Tax=Enterococcus dongliensis TaxID=2559925 RepID=UPI00288F780D|nr:tyrosine-type recombinase/integrase [Enterococcus dongliensis]MDT2671723.1 tyrosine-type recombinase/integrase [Enterococcus dongliensis]